MLYRGAGGGAGALSGTLLRMASVCCHLHKLRVRLFAYSRARASTKHCSSIRFLFYIFAYTNLT